jgi:pilus assembly protein Flp/PilA
MSAIVKRAKAFLVSEDGPTTVEYAVMLALIVAVAIGTIALLGPKVKDAFQKTADGMDAAGAGG